MPKCERCGTEVQLIDMNAIVDMMAGDEVPSTAIYFGDPTKAPTWYEQHSQSRVEGRLTTLMIEHCVHRCDAARDGLLRNKEQTAHPVDPC
jgi:hypothetical protein